MVGSKEKTSSQEVEAVGPWILHPALANFVASLLLLTKTRRVWRQHRSSMERIMVADVSQSTGDLASNDDSQGDTYNDKQGCIWSEFG